jgi:FkbM family methyltransferase
MSRERLRAIVNGVLARGGLRLVSAAWGPRGFASAFGRLRRSGFVPRQIVDVGASDGAWTRECRTIFGDARYFLVDPLEENRAALAALAAADPRVRFWIGALGAAPGELELHVHGDQSSFLPSEYDRRGAAPRRVAVRPLDALVAAGEIAPPSLIKADVQGYELDVLRGAAESLASCEVVLLEVSYRRAYAGAPLAHEVVAFMGARGFRIYDVCSYAQRPGDGELFQSDLVFVRDGSVVFAHEGYEPRP